MKNEIIWEDFDWYGLDYTTKLGKYQDFVFDIRYDCDTIKGRIKPNSKGCCLDIYFRNARIESKLGNMKGLITFSENYLKQFLEQYNSEYKT